MAAGVGQWLHEPDNVTEVTETFGAVALSPHRVSTFLSLTRPREHQVTPDISDYVVESRRKSVGVALDKAGLLGSGIFEPEGIYSTTGIKTVTFGATATWAKVLSFESQITRRTAMTAQFPLSDTQA